MCRPAHLAVTGKDPKASQVFPTATPSKMVNKHFRPETSGRIGGAPKAGGRARGEAIPCGAREREGSVNRVRAACPDGPDGAGSCPDLAAMPVDSDPPPTHGLLSWTMKVTLAAGLAAAVLGHTVARSVDPEAARLAVLDADPVVTGSIGPSARATALDPCALRGR